ncbi:hypothetical protein DSUL_60120 [Desulfovibrionales bacterium]
MRCLIGARIFYESILRRYVTTTKSKKILLTEPQYSYASHRFPLNIFAKVDQTAIHINLEIRLLLLG